MNGVGGRATARWWALIVVSLIQLMIVLDATIVNIALPAAQRELGMSDASRQWVITAYALVFGSLLLLGGRVSSRVGHRRAATFSLIGFAVASVIGGLATSPLMLFAARGVQGVFAAVLAPAVLALLSIMFTESRDRGAAFGVFAAVSAAGSAVGLLAGGVFTEYLDWRWCLYVNVPISLVALLGTPLLPPAREDQRPRVDLIGALLSAAALAAIVWGFTEAESYGWADARVVLYILSGAVLLIVFFVIETRVAHPLLPLEILRAPTRAAAFLASLLMQVALFGFYLFMTFFTQNELGYTPIQAGLAMVITAGGAVVGSTLLAGQLLNRVRPVMLVVPGLLAVAAGLVWLSQLPAGRPDVFLGYLLPAQMLIGIGMGVVITPTSSLATSGLGSADAGVASAIYNATQQIGAAMGTALANTIATAATATAVASASMTAAEAALTGYRTAMWAGAAIVLIGALGSGVLLARRSMPSREVAISSTRENS